MLRKFLEGIVFGAGFALAFVLVAVLAASQLIPVSFRSAERQVAVESQGLPSAQVTQESGRQFHELPMEEQIKQATVIALARYEPSPDGKMRAVFREFLKKAPNATIYYKIGDEFPSGSFYPNESKNFGDGLIVFFVGSPANMRLSMTYSGDRIHSLADIPIELFRKKCEAPSA